MKNFIKCALFLCLNNGICFSGSNVQGFRGHFDFSDNHESINSALMLVQNEQENVHTRADIAVHILCDPALAAHHETIAPLAVALMQNEQVDVNAMVDITCSILLSYSLTTHHKNLAPLAVTLVQNEQIDDDTRVKLAVALVKNEQLYVQERADARGNITQIITLAHPAWDVHNNRTFASFSVAGDAG